MNNQSRATDQDNNQQNQLNNHNKVSTIISTSYNNSKIDASSAASADTQKAHAGRSGVTQDNHKILSTCGQQMPKARGDAGNRRIDQHPFLTYLHSYPALVAPTHQLLNWDTSLCIYINRYSNYQSIAAFFKLISRLGDGWFWGAMLMAALLLQISGALNPQLAATSSMGLQMWLPLLTVVITSSVGVGLYKILKVKTVRPRPYQVHQVIIMGERPLDVFSFPSGHTLQAVLFTCVLGSYFPLLLWLMLPFALLVALSRMILGLHYPTDVLVGAAIGFALAQMAPFIYDALALVLG